MPFTLAHPAAVLPLRPARALPFSALVVGSMSPDFPYFLLLHNELYHVGHSLLGLVTFCLPASLLVLAVYHGLLKFPLLALLPDGVQRRLLAPARWGGRVRSAGDAAGTGAAIILGAFTHQVWDSFTHINGAVVTRVPWLHSPFPVYKVLQHGSTVVGLTLLWWAFRRWLATLKPVPGELLPRPAPRAVIVAATLLLAVALTVGAMYSHHEDILWGGVSLKKQVADAFESATGVVVLGVLAYSVWWRLALRGAIDTNRL